MDASSSTQRIIFPFFHARRQKSTCT
jgi:hypothetical protein